MEREKIVQTAGRDALGNFASDFARYNDDVLFGEVWNDTTLDLRTKSTIQREVFLPLGEKNPYGKYFTGQSYLAQISSEQIPAFNVTFEPGCRNFWHIHHAESGGGQMLICIGGRGWNNKMV